VIELLLEAERALSFGLVDRAEQLYKQVASNDPRNSIAVVGLARVALERADDLGAYLLARRALAIDPENEAAQRLATRLEEVMRTRGDAVPTTPDVPGWPSRPSVVPPSMAPKPPGRAVPGRVPAEARSGGPPSGAPAAVDASPGMPPAGTTPTGAAPADDPPGAATAGDHPATPRAPEVRSRQRSLLDRIRRR
jgi:hypothetical protein